MKLPTRYTAAALAAMGLTGLAGSALAGPFTPGDIVVSRVGDGIATLGNTGNAIFLDEYTPAGTLIQSVPLPTTASGSTKPIASSGSATSEGSLNLSGNGQSLTYYGYNTTIPAGASLTSSASATVNRIVDSVDSSGNVTTSLALTDAATGNNPRSAYSPDGINFFTGGGTGGVRYAAGSASPTTSTQVDTTAIVNIRVVSGQNGNLYFSTGSTAGAGIGIYQVGPGGFGTTANQASPQILALPSTNPYDFYFTPDGNTLYVADATVGLRKFTATGGVFNTTPVATFSAGTGVGLFGLTGVTIGGITTLYATGLAGSISTLQSFTDNGVNTALTTIATAGTNQAFRGVDFAPALAPAPEPSGLLAMAVGIGAMGLLAARRRTI